VSVRTDILFDDSVFFSPCDLHVEKAIASSSMVPIGKNIHICFADSLFNKI